ncbi:hypothetical protein KAU33_10420 [Candidatus Dependentiae bacterium]|nr:hypothetical protein [Candidatus Dependentiae bacterium]
MVYKLEKNGWFVRIKKGTYYISDLNSRGFLKLSPYKTAQVIAEDSYISFENSLQFHKMFDQLLRTYTSVSLNQHRDREINNLVFKYKKTTPDHYYGWEEENIENYLVRIATPEKAIIDMLYFNRELLTVDLILEILRNYEKDFNFNKLFEFSKRNKIIITRALGFIFDLLKFDSTKFHEIIKTRNDSANLTKDAEIFNSKWRLYYNKELRKYEDF